MKLLLIEDEPALSETIEKYFTDEGSICEVCSNVGTAVEKISMYEYDCILLDIGLPDGDGFNVVDWLRQHRNLAQLPLVVYSGREITPEERRQLTLGPTHFLTKARVQPQQLEALVLTMLRSSRQMEEATPVTTGARKP